MEDVWNVFIDLIYSFSCFVRFYHKPPQPLRSRGNKMMVMFAYGDVDQSSTFNCTVSTAKANDPQSQQYLLQNRLGAEFKDEQYYYGEENPTEDCKFSGSDVSADLPVSHLPSYSEINLTTKSSVGQQFEKPLQFSIPSTIDTQLELSNDFFSSATRSHKNVVKSINSTLTTKTEFSTVTVISTSFATATKRDHFTYSVPVPVLTSYVTKTVTVFNVSAYSTVSPTSFMRRTTSLPNDVYSAVPPTLISRQIVSTSNYLYYSTVPPTVFRRRRRTSMPNDVYSTVSPTSLNFIERTTYLPNDVYLNPVGTSLYKSNAETINTNVLRDQIAFSVVRIKHYMKPFTVTHSYSQIPYPATVFKDIGSRTKITLTTNPNTRSIHVPQMQLFSPPMQTDYRTSRNVEF